MRRSFIFGIFVAGCALFSAIAAQAENVKKPSVEEQLNQIAASQRAIEQRLSNLEAGVAMINNTFSAVGNALRPGGPMGGGAAAGGCGGPGAPGGAANFPPPEDFNKVYKIDQDHSSIKGNPKAKITIVEFSDFQCPFSQRFHPVVDDVLKAYPNDVNYILKNFPLSFHPNARPATKASLAAREQGKYWEMVDLLFKNGRELSEEKYKEFAKQIGLDVDKFMKDYKERDAEWEKLIQEDFSVANSSAVGGTPTFYINGKKTMARDLQSFKTEIDGILKGNVKK